MRALIVEHGFSRAALAGARALADAGWTVGVGAPREDTLAMASRAVERSHWVPNPHKDPARFVSGIRDAIDENGYRVVFGADDSEVMALSGMRVGIPAIVPYPPHETVTLALDKLELTPIAEAVGLACPYTAAADDEALAQVAGPVVVKGRAHASIDPGSQARQNASVEPDRAAATRRAAEIRATGGEPILQELIAGELMALVCLAGPDGSLLASVQQQAERTFPPGSGVTVRGRTVTPEPALVGRAAALLRELGWFGIAELQFMREPGGEPQLIDLNGRFYGSLALGVASGPNMPAAWAALALERPAPPLPASKAGVRYQWLEGDLRRALEERRGGLVRDVFSCLRYAFGATHSISSLRDPRPLLRLLAEMVSRTVRRAGVSGSASSNDAAS